MAERRYGILIASSQFPKEPKLENLRCPENDVDALNKILTSKAHGEFIKTFTLKNAPHHKVQLKINQVLRKADKNDLVLIYYSGHGKLNPAGRLHLACTNTIVSALEATSIPVSMIKEYADISPSNKVVLILDCCFAGAGGDDFTKGSLDDQLQLISGGRGTYIMTASTGIQVAVEKESDQYGVFTKHIIEGISKGDADTDGDGLVTMDELYSYVHDRVLKEGFQEPMKWDLNVRGDLVIARSGKILREDRRKQIRKILLDLVNQDKLPDQILSKAFHVISLDPSELSGELVNYSDLLDQLLQDRIRVIDFIDKWYRVVPERSERRIVEPIKVEEEGKEAPSGEPEGTEAEEEVRAPKVKEIARDDPFIAYSNGTVVDTSTGLTWAAKDNGHDVNWQEAKEYCKNYRGGGYTYWRVPTLDELEGIFDKSKENRHGYRVTELIDISSTPWASETRGSVAAVVNFTDGDRRWYSQSLPYFFRALPVRAGNW